LNLQSGERNLERSLRMQSSKSTVFPLPVGAEITMFTSEKKHTYMEALTLQGSEVSAEKPKHYFDH